jgi:Ni2+-binding GTPase involved in maturation of urease and hydrogenase
MLASDIMIITKMTLANVEAVFVSNMKSECLTMVEHFLVSLLNGIYTFLSLKLNLRA